MYVPFPIYDYRSGLVESREPFLLPHEAFTVAENVFFYRGRLLKRQGYEKFAVGTGGSGVNVLDSPPVMGIWEYAKNDGTSALLAFDTDFLYEYNSTDDDWVGKGGHPGTPDWTGDDSQYFWCTNWRDLFFITNNKDYIKYWNGSTLTNLRPDCDSGAGTNYLDTCKILIPDRGRLIALNTEESTDGRCQQRARCSNVDSYTAWDDDIYVDEDTSEYIMGATKIRGQIIVFFNKSTRWLRYTGAADVPYTFEPLDPTAGLSATFSLKDFNGISAGLSQSEWTGTDGLSVFPITKNLPGIVDTMNPEKFDYSYGFVSKELRQYLCSYASLTQDYPDRLLCLNYEDTTYSIHTIPVHCAGTYQQADTPTIDSISDTYDSIAYSYDDVTKAAGYPIMLIGDRSGYVHKLFTVNDDDGGNIASRAKTKMLIPYDGYQSKLGYIDIVAKSNVDTTVSVKVYKDYSDAAFLTRELSLHVSGSEKSRERIRIMENSKKGSFMIEIADNTTNNPYVIDGIIPYFKRMGPVR